jgi:emp24/gp25L/p24 family/GOLD
VKDIDVENIRQAMKRIYTEVRSLATEAKMSFIRQDSVNQIVEDNNSSNFYTTIVESLIFVGIAAAQVMYIRNMLEQKRII